MNVLSPTEPKSGSGRKNKVVSKGKKKTNGLICRREENVLRNRGFRSRLAGEGAIHPLKRNLTETESELESYKATVVHTNATGIHSELESGAESSDENSDDHDSSDRAGQHVTTGKDKDVKKKRYIIFLGNLPKTISRDDIISHFEKRGVPISEFRLLTHKDSGKSKGCGFMELSSNVVMQNALKFHRSRISGKHINVEITCGGGGKGEERKKRIQDRNRKLRLEKASKKSFKH